MLLYTADDPAPNPRRVHLFLDAKGLEVPRVTLSLFAREHKAPEMLARNPRGQVPFLELDDGTVIAETISICRYLDELHPAPPMFGDSPLGRAQVDMWIRRVETALGQPVGLVWQHGHPMTAKLVAQIPAMAEASRVRALEAMIWFDTQLQGRDWLTDAPGMADIVLLTSLEFAEWIGLPVPEDMTALRAYLARATARFVRAGAAGVG
ncbi:MAG: glutathione S-transferase family protein [Polymorphobacter sp.]|uniref:glutathione S-transferase family protein n=1 Tax=Polymorphobacter sp. TaxID=1909290 RepID=UPI003A8B7F50